MYAAKPTEQQLAWHDMEMGVLIHFCAQMYRPELPGNWYKTDAVRTALAPQTLHPDKLDPEQWVRSAYELGAKYAVLVAKHATGFAMWDTKVNDFSIAHTDWRGGGGDACREFVAACKKYGLKPGFYYSTVCNGYYNINDDLAQNTRSDDYRAYVKNVEAQLTELWSGYGGLAELWFDGGVIPPERGGPEVLPLLRRYQPDAICFQGPNEWKNNIRWVGNEDGLAPETCWAATNAGETDEPEGEGDPDGKYYRPAECDMANRKHEAFGDGWSWQPNEAHLCYSPEHLLDCYVRSVGRNANFMLGMAIGTDGRFEDEEQFHAFGKLLKETFGTPLAVSRPAPGAKRCVITPGKGQNVKYLAVREDIREGQRIRGFRVLADGKPVYTGRSVGHKRIVPLGGVSAGTIVFEITEAAGQPALRDVALY